MDEYSKKQREFIFSVKRSISSENKTVKGIKETRVEITEGNGETRLTSMSRILKGLKSGDIKLKRSNKKYQVQQDIKKLENEEK